MKLIIRDIKDVKITKICDYKIHFKIKNKEYFILDYYECGESWSRLFQKRRDDGTGRNNTVFLSKHGSFDFRKGKFSKPKSHYVKEFVLKLQRGGYVTTPFEKQVDENGNRISKIRGMQEIYRLRIQELELKINEMELEEIKIINQMKR